MKPKIYILIILLWFIKNNEALNTNEILASEEQNEIIGLIEEFREVLESGEWETLKQYKNEIQEFYIKKIKTIKLNKIEWIINIEKNIDDLKNKFFDWIKDENVLSNEKIITEKELDNFNILFMKWSLKVMLNLTKEQLKSEHKNFTHEFKKWLDKIKEENFNFKLFEENFLKWIKEKVPTNFEEWNKFVEKNKKEIEKEFLEWNTELKKIIFEIPKEFPNWENKKNNYLKLSNMFIEDVTNNKQEFNGLNNFIDYINKNFIYGQKRLEKLEQINKNIPKIYSNIKYNQHEFTEYFIKCPRGVELLIKIINKTDPIFTKIILKIKNYPLNYFDYIENLENSKKKFEKFAEIGSTKLKAINNDFERYKNLWIENILNKFNKFIKCQEIFKKSGFNENANENERKLKREHFTSKENEIYKNCRKQFRKLPNDISDKTLKEYKLTREGMNKLIQFSYELTDLFEVLKKSQFKNFEVKKFENFDEGIIKTAQQMYNKKYKTMNWLKIVIEFGKKLKTAENQINKFINENIKIRFNDLIQVYKQMRIYSGLNKSSLQLIKKTQTLVLSSDNKIINSLNESEDLNDDINKIKYEFNFAWKVNKQIIKDYLREINKLKNIGKLEINFQEIAPENCEELSLFGEMSLKSEMSESSLSSSLTKSESTHSMSNSSNESFKSVDGTLESSPKHSVTWSFGSENSESSSDGSSIPKIPSNNKLETPPVYPKKINSKQKIKADKQQKLENASEIEKEYKEWEEWKNNVFKTQEDLKSTVNKISKIFTKIINLVEIKANKGFNEVKIEEEEKGCIPVEKINSGSLETLMSDLFFSKI
ncbi:hypothetical protein Mgra_00003413 [Meloidogyne graminicola]|uniref:Uncharacterized protein n=1 Tax=Meloidogyne graminicola TaxID=189291 RepID=A0A8S9ZVC1_9BILA|nr:hypothetical protein Mgra_00003413 [Meloidogyne graminicola]